MSRRAIIAGAGIGGLATACALSQSGFRVTIYERACDLEEFGAGLQLTPNATRVLSLLGLLERAARRLGHSGRHLRYAGFGRHRPHAHQARRRGATLGSAVSRSSSRRPPARARRGRPAQRRMFGSNLGSTVAGIATDGERVSVGLKRGAASMQDAADLLIGADGLRSRVRERLGLGESR